VSEEGSDDANHLPTDVEPVDEALTDWWQGDTVSGIPLSWFADGERPLTPEGVRMVSLHEDLPDDMIVHVEVMAHRVAIVTQTCDLNRTANHAQGQPLVQISPVVDLAGHGALHDAQARHSPHFAPVPGLGPTMFVDLRKCTTVEKAVLMRVADTRVVGCRNDLDRAIFSKAVARQRGRFAFPNDVTRAVAPLQKRVRDKRSKQSAEAKRIAEVTQIRVGCDGEWFGEAIRVELVFLVRGLAPVGDDPDPVSDETRDLLGSEPDITKLSEYLDKSLSPVDQSATWDTLVGKWAALCRSTGTVIAISARAESPNEFTIAEAWNAPKLDLDHLSGADVV
jgi:hypothetical protein